MTTSHFTRRGVLAGTGLAIALGLAACRASDKKADDAGSSPAAGSDGGSAAPSDGGSAAAGSDAGGRDIDRKLPYLELASDSTGPTVDLLLDFRCPPCKEFMTMHTDYIDGLVHDAKAKVRIHPRPMLDARRGSTYSQDTASAAAAVYAQDPALLMPFEHAMYAAQAPTGDDPDPDLQQIATIAKGVGADATAVAQIMQRTYVPWTLDVVEPAAAKLDVGTPTVIVNGKIWEGDWSASGALEKAISA